jgi:hypothetical protein
MDWSGLIARAIILERIRAASVEKCRELNY